MQLIVQEGTAILSLKESIQAHDEALRSTALQEITGQVKVFYRDYEIVRVEAKEGNMEILPAGLSGLFWLTKGRRYQLKTGE